MAKLYRRGKRGTFWFQFQGERRSTGHTDRTAAELFVQNVQRRAADPTYRAADGTTLGQQLLALVEHKREHKRAEGTLSMYDVHIAHLARVLDQDTPLASIDAAELDRYVSVRRAEQAKDTTIHKELSTLRGALKLARRHRKYPYALDEVMPVVDGVSKPGTAHLKHFEVEQLLALEKLPYERKVVVAFIVLTGADWASVERAKRGDVNLRAGTVRVRGSKTSHRDRTVPILKPLAQLAAVVADAMPFRPWGNVRRDLEVACRRAGVTKVTPRDLRRTHGHLLRAGGVSPGDIAKMLGHADGRQAERTYAQISPTELGKVLARRLNRTKQVQVAGSATAPSAKRRKKRAA